MGTEVLLPLAPKGPRLLSGVGTPCRLLRIHFVAEEGRGPAGCFPSNVTLSKPLAVEETHPFVLFSSCQALSLICFFREVLRTHDVGNGMVVVGVGQEMEERE